MGRTDKILFVVVVLGLGFGYASNFLLGDVLTTFSLGQVVILVFVKLLALVAPALWAYAFPTGMRQLAGAFALAALVALIARGFGAQAYPFAVACIQRIAAGLSISLTGWMLFLLPSDCTQQGVYLGFATAMASFPVLHLIPGLSDWPCTVVLTILYVLAAIFVTTRPLAATPLPAGRRGTEVISAVLASHRSAMMPVMFIGLMLMFVFGMFQDWCLANGYGFVRFDGALVAACALFLGLYLTVRHGVTDGWLGRFFSIVMLVCVGGLLLVMVVPGVPHEAFASYFGIATVVAMAPLCIYVTRIVRDCKASPALLFGPLTAPIVVALDLGNLFNMILSSAFGPGVYNVSTVAATALAALASAVVVLFMLRVPGDRFGNAVSRCEAAGRRGARSARLDNTEELLATGALESGPREAMLSHSECEDASDRAPEPEAYRVDYLRSVLMQQGLSEREALIVVPYSQGRSVPYISKELFLAESTVKSHIKHAYVKLGVHNKQELLDCVEGLVAK